MNTNTDSLHEVFYVVESRSGGGERNHRLHSDLYETRPQAEAELARLSHEAGPARYSVWGSATYVEPAEWRHRVVRTDGTLILPRLRRVESSPEVGVEGEPLPDARTN
jgi:hypothetical protein